MALTLKQTTLYSSCLRTRPVTRTHLRVRAGVTAQQIIVVNPSEEVLKAKAVRSWPTWGCEVSKFPWSYSENETCYVLKGRVFVTPDGGEAVEIKAGDMATFPAGMSCTWDVKETIKKHYNFHRQRLCQEEDRIAFAGPEHGPVQAL